ncbi:glutathione S-transferase [Ramaria rubella]|nr:glutathione S-transferase [Ramaria rubella]
MTSCCAAVMSEYTLIYWGGIPGRGEYIRLAFEYTKTPYSEVNTLKKITSFFSPKGNHFAPPILDVNGSFTLSQTPAILAYLAPRLGLSGSDEVEQARINQLTLTALDVSNEAHDVHHPISSALYYEDQKPEALRRAKDFRESRIPKFFTHFETVLSANGTGVLIGSKVSTADLTLFQVLEGLTFAFPTCINALKTKGSFKMLFALQDRLRSELESYLKSDRHTNFGMGLYRYYPELN